MNDPIPLPGQTIHKRLLGIFDIREIPDVEQPLATRLEALFKYEVVTMRQIMGGAAIVDSKVEHEEWREVTTHGCFPTTQQKYKVS